MHKIWHKPLHTRKVWKQMPLIDKIIYYMQPFVGSFIEVWLEPLPFPTIFKIFHSCVLALFLMLPLIYPTAVLICYYAIAQYFIESDFDLRFPNNLDLIHFVENSFNSEIPNEKYERFLISYIEKCRYLATAAASCVDYVRLALTLVMG